MERLNTLIIDMTAEKRNRFRINGENIDLSNMQSIDIHIESGSATIQTVENRLMSFGGKT